MIEFNHFNFNVLNLEKSIAFYKEAIGLSVVREKDYRKEPYNLGDEEFHLAFKTDEYDAFHKKHEEMGCICYENPSMGIYFINDPDGYWIEIVPVR